MPMLSAIVFEVCRFCCRTGLPFVTFVISHYVSDLLDAFLFFLEEVAVDLPTLDESLKVAA